MNNKMIILGTVMMLLVSLSALAQTRTEWLVNYPIIKGKMITTVSENVFIDKEITKDIPTLERFEGASDGNANVGGSGPFIVEFTGEGHKSESTHYTWEIADNKEFSNLLYQKTAPFTLSSSDTTYVTEVLRYTFDRTGTSTTPFDYYVRLIRTNDIPNDEAVTCYYKITVYESRIEVPNVFTPGSDGINDIFMVAYRSIKKFSGRVFNRWGLEVFSWTDPSKGWDGRVGNKKASTGVYFYVIEAEGTDGQAFRLRGDLNLFNEQ